MKRSAAALAAVLAAGLLLSVALTATAPAAEAEPGQPEGAAGGGACDARPFHALFVFNVGGAAELGYGDVHIAENLSEELREAYCVGEGRVTILLDDGKWRDEGGYGAVVGDSPYRAATQENVRAALEAAGRDLAGHEDARFFMMLSSHGNVYAEAVRGEPCTEARAAHDGGSYAFLNDGLLADCELGAMLNATLPEGVDSTVLVDCSYCGGFADAFSPTQATGDSATVVATNRQVLAGCTMTTECYQRPGGAQFYILWWEGVRTMEADGWHGDEFGDPAAPAAPEARDGVVTAEEAYWYAVGAARARGDALEVQASFQLQGGVEDPFPVAVNATPDAGAPAP